MGETKKNAQSSMWQFNMDMNGITMLSQIERKLCMELMKQPV